jgi:hypothetical protein
MPSVKRLKIFKKVMVGIREVWFEFANVEIAKE